MLCDSAVCLRRLANASGKCRRRRLLLRRSSSRLLGPPSGLLQFGSGVRGPPRQPVSFSLANRVYSISDTVFPAPDLDTGWSGAESSGSLDRLSARELTGILVNLPRMKTSSRHGNIAKRVEDAFLGKISALSSQGLLLAANCFFRAEYRAPRFLSRLFEHVDARLGRGCQGVDQAVLTNTMFFVYFHGGAPESLLSKVEGYLKDNFAAFGINDIGMICLGYFRGNRRVKSFELLDLIGEKLLRDYSSVDPNHLIHILKVFRHGGYIKPSFFERLGDELASDDFGKLSSLNQIMHIVMAFASSRMHHAGVMRTGLLRSVRLVSEMSRNTHFRSKDIAKIVWATGMVSEDADKAQIECLLKAYRRTESDHKKLLHPESLSDIAVGLIYLGLFPLDLMADILQEKIALKLRGLTEHALTIVTVSFVDLPGLEKSSQLLLVHHTLGIECPNYAGPKLTEHFVRQLQRDSREALAFELHTRPGLAAVNQTLQQLLGSAKVHCHLILPHFTTADIEIQLDESRRPIEFQPIQYTSIDPVTATLAWKREEKITDVLLQKLIEPTRNQTNEKIAVEVVGKNQIAINRPLVTGAYRTKLRQLETLGYGVLMIMPDDAKKLQDISEAERREWMMENVVKKCGIIIE